MTATLTSTTLSPIEAPAAICDGCGTVQPGPHDFRCEVHRAEPIAPGDFIGSKLGGFWCGIVTRPASVALGRKRSIPGYQVQLANGQLDWIDTEHAVLIAKA